MSVPFPPRFVPAPIPKREKLKSAIHVLSGILQPLDGVLTSRASSWWTTYGTTARNVLIPFGTVGTDGYRTVKLADFEGGSSVADVGTTDGSLTHPAGSTMIIGRTGTSSWLGTNILTLLTNSVFGGDLNVPGYGASSAHPWDYVDIWEPGMYEVESNLSHSMTCTLADDTLALDFFTGSQINVPVRLVTFLIGRSKESTWVNALEGGDVALQSEVEVFTPLGIDPNRTTRSAAVDVDSSIRLALSPALFDQLSMVRLVFGVVLGGSGSTPRLMQYHEGSTLPVTSIHYWPHSSIKISAYDYDFELGMNAVYPVVDAPYFNSAM